MNEFVVSIHPESQARLDAVVEGLRAAGLTDIEVRRRFGLVVGAAMPEAGPRLEAVDGVKSVRRGVTYTAKSEGA